MRGAEEWRGHRMGFSLSELVVALVLFQIGLLAVAGWVLLAQETLLEAELTQRAALEAEALGDSLLQVGAGGEGRVSRGWGELIWEEDGGRAALVVRGVRARHRDTVVVLVLGGPGGGSGG